VLLMSSIFHTLQNILYKTLKQNHRLGGAVFTFVTWVMGVLYISNGASEDGDASILLFEEEKAFFKDPFFYLLDWFLTYIVSFNFFRKTKVSENFNVKISQNNNNAFYTFNTNVVFPGVQLFLYGLRSVWKHMSFWVLPLVVAAIFVYFSFFLKSLPFAKVVFAYVLLANMYYLFISGFVFFIKKYQYRLYTSAIQRFWRRSLIYFWAIESCLFATFIYLILNANNEPVYMYDNVQLFKTHLFSWRLFLTKAILSAMLVILTYMLMVSLKWNTFTKTNNLVLLITVLILYITWLEFYQLFHLMNCYGTTNWVYDFSEHLWNLEAEFKRTRIVNHYVTIGLVAKFWHIVFAVFFWIFFILRGLELSRYRYPLLAACLQNFFIIYIMAWLYMYPWLKYVTRKLLDVPYFWFFVNNRRFCTYLFINDIKLYCFGLTDIVYEVFEGSYKSFSSYAFFYWHESSVGLGNTQFRKHNIRDLFIRNVIV